MTAREKIFGILREILGEAGDAIPAGSAAEIPAVPSPSPDADPVPRFVAMAAQAGAEVREFDGAESLRQWFTGFLREAKIKRIWMGDVASHGLDSDAVESAATAMGIDILRVDRDPAAGPDARAFLSSCDLAVTTAFFGCADSGVVGVESGPREPRAASLLPEAHIALLRRTDIFPDLARALSERGHPLPAALTLIGGPSRTADIEKVLVTGVHGPKSFIVCLL